MCTLNQFCLLVAARLDVVMWLEQASWHNSATGGHYWDWLPGQGEPYGADLERLKCNNGES